MEKCPILEARPDADFLYNQMVHIVENKNNIEQMGYESRKYIESVHNYIDVAKQYVNIWNAR